jgi:hypothetical protein
MLLMDARGYRTYANALGTVLLTLSITFLLHENLGGDLVRRMMLGFEQVGKSRDAAALPVGYRHYIDVLVRTTSNSPARAVDEWLQLNHSITLGFDRLRIPWGNRKPALDLRTITEKKPVYSLHAQLVE